MATSSVTKPEQHPVKIEMAGLIQLLAVNLYSEPDVFLRELIQNAHDAIQRAGNTEGRIHVRVNRERREIVIEDNGSGLTRDEIHEFLSTIGRSGTGEMKRALEASGRYGATNMIGQFGIGLLSAFLVADRVAVHTRAAESEGLRWESSGTAQYTVEESPRDTVGTTVTLSLKQGQDRYLDPDLLTDIAVRYADLIGTPIFVQSSAIPVNRVTAPWRRTYANDELRAEAHADFWRARFRDERPLYTWPVHLQFTYFDREQVPREGEIRGVLGVTDRNIPGVQSGGALDVFVRGMFVSAGNRDVLPKWAGFVQGAIECPQLAPNAARDGIVRDDALTALRQALERETLNRLLALRREDPMRFEDLLHWHSYQILSMCVQPECETAFEELADVVPLPTCSGQATTIGYEREQSSDRTIRFLSDRRNSAQYSLLAEARGWRVIDAAGGFVEIFLRRYERTWPHRIRLVALDQLGGAELFRPLPPQQAAQFRRLLAASRAALPGVNVEIRLFEPADAPALLTDDSSSRARRDIGALADDPSLPEYLRSAAKELVVSTPAVATLYLNASSPLIRDLAGRQALLEEAGEAVFQGLYGYARLLHAPRLNPRELREIGHNLQNILSLLLRNGGEERRNYEVQ
jgi:molecular chaperone HtpG